MATDVLLIGSGGREHALAWKLAQSPELGRLYAAPGNPGIAQHAEVVSLDVTDHAAVIRFCETARIGLVVVGPEVPLVAGLADALRASDVVVFGPSAAAARLEGSKGFTKDLCTRQSIPTARYRRFTDAVAARDYVREQGAPIVIKADGLAAGKGVTVAQHVDEALAAVDACFADGVGAEVVVEECMTGPEVSLFCLCDGERAIPFGTAQDHKRAFDGDQGPNTGGMGAFSPSPLMDDALLERVMREIIRPTLADMREMGSPFAGVLYAGLMLTPEGPKLVEYNVRFGDPECQVLMPRLASDLLPILRAAAEGALDGVDVQWTDNAAVTVVLASRGYPGGFESGTVVRVASGDLPGTILFHAGTRLVDDELLAVGGRVLAATGVAATIPAAAGRAYELAASVEWPNGFYRRDIAASV
ncbi:phosphoribosylamine--glycine ligase [Aureimonas jatrophae]|uniref:Phosphoribosylamine--glycine ligase n=1 Tax=Aureimonas jatrophae TaxID=1166073 RepID=A0A1H0GMZ8_9HYPH|nr:phosphoribosylamine--glycine ligase [Aureimonas jatrophae]MBB3949648.1 phosphoribosylamine--glycine ligase [Aureimonas jatrophae]SDO08051.1 phosphoribosylamine--glycine ligase [Aureimonas jatrophae]